MCVSVCVDPMFVSVRENYARIVHIAHVTRAHLTPLLTIYGKQHCLTLSKDTFFLKRRRLAHIIYVQHEMYVKTLTDTDMDKLARAIFC